MYRMVYEHAEIGLKDAMVLAYLTGQRVSDTLRMDESDVRDEQIWVIQGKTSAKRRIEVIGELKSLVTRIMARKAGYKVSATKLIISQDGHPMTYSMLRKRFDDARERAGVNKAAFQFRDLRAKAGTDKAESSGGIVQARNQLGHTTVVMTENMCVTGRGKKLHRQGDCGPLAFLRTALVKKEQGSQGCNP